MTEYNPEKMSWYKDKVPCPDCCDSKQHMDGVRDNGEICYTCGGAARISQTLAKDTKRCP
jgi:hypothetical protein